MHFLAATTVAALLAASASPADAGSRSNSRWSGQNASAWWTQQDEVSGPFGNLHVGSLYAYSTTKGKGDAYAFIEDWDCDPGEVPGWPGHDEEPTEDGLCDWVGFRWGEGYNMSFTVDRKLNSATLSGQLTLSAGGHGGGPAGQPMVNMRWTGSGDVTSSTSTYRYRDGGSSYSESYRSSWRQATVSGTLGAMGFAPDTSGGSISSFDMRSRSRTK